MKRLVFLSFIILSMSATAQYRIDWGISMGATNYLGDIGGVDQERNNFYKDIKISETRYAFGGYLRSQFSRNFSMSASIMVGRIEGWDSHTEYAPRRTRNLNFRNEIQEFAVRAEFALFQANDVGGRGYYNPDFKLFGFAGLGVVHHEPMGNLDGTWYKLRELNTEALDKEYSSMALSIPMGFGFYFTHKKKHRFGWEFGYRVTTTDYLDDISTNYAYESELMESGGELAVALANQSSFELAEEAFGEASEYYNYGYNPGAEVLGQRNPRGINNNNDGYMFMVLSYGYVIPSKSSFKRKFSKSKSRYKSRFKGNKRISSSRKSRAKF